MSDDFLSEKEMDEILAYLTGEDWSPSMRDADAVLDQEKMQPAHIRDVVDRHALNYDHDKAPEWVKESLKNFTLESTEDPPIALDSVKRVISGEWQDARMPIETAKARAEVWETVNYLLSRVK
jgi:hypothetical protein